MLKRGFIPNQKNNIYKIIKIISGRQRVLSSKDGHFSSVWQSFPNTVVYSVKCFVVLSEIKFFKFFLGGMPTLVNLAQVRFLFFVGMMSIFPAWWNLSLLLHSISYPSLSAVGKLSLPVVTSVEVAAMSLLLLPCLFFFSRSYLLLCLCVAIDLLFSFLLLYLSSKS